MRKLFLLVLIITLSIVMAVFVANSDVNVNNRFVINVVIFAVNILALLYLYVRQKLMRNLLIIIISMSAFAFALVPLYDVFCKVTGLNGKIDLLVAKASTQDIDYTRNITVEFVVSQNQLMPWEFKPKHNFITVHPGQLADTAYYAKNTTRGTMFAQAIPSISPAIARKYFKKVECFCFSKQKLGPGETAYLGLRFYLDNDIPKEIQRVTLAYTIFDITDQEH